MNVSGEETYIALSVEAEQWLCIHDVGSIVLVRQTARADIPAAHTHALTHKIHTLAQFFRQALSYSVVVVLITSFHCEHISALLNLGSCLLIQRVGLCKCVSARVYICVCVCIINYTHQRPTRVIPGRIICVYLTKLMLWFTRTFVDIIPLACFSPSLLSFSTSVSALRLSDRRKSTLAVFAEY